MSQQPGYNDYYQGQPYQEGGQQQYYYPQEAGYDQYYPTYQAAGPYVAQPGYEGGYVQQPYYTNATLPPTEKEPDTKLAETDPIPMTDDVLTDPEERGPKPWWGCCGCSKNMCIGLLVGLGLLLLTIILCGVFLAPKFPQVQLLGIVKADAPVVDNSDPTQITMSFTLTVSLSVYNPNPYTFKADKVDLMVYTRMNETLLDGKPSVGNIVGHSSAVLDINSGNDERKVGRGNITSLTIQKHQNITISMPVVVYYSPPSGVDVLDDPLFAELMQVCGYTSPSRNMDIRYTATITNNILKNFNYFPTMENAFTLSCPVDQKYLLEFMGSGSSDIGSKLLAYKARVNPTPSKASVKPANKAAVKSGTPSRTS